MDVRVVMADLDTFEPLAAWLRRCDGVALEHSEHRVYEVVISPPGSVIAALVKVQPVHLRVIAA